MASSGVRRLQQAKRASNRPKLSPSQKSQVSRKISFLRRNEGLPQRQAVGKAFGIIRNRANR